MSLFILAFAVIGTIILAISKAATPTNPTASIQAAGGASLSLSPASGSYDSATNFTVVVYVDSDEDINTVGPQITYDTTKIDFVSIDTTGGAFPASAPGTGASNGTVTLNYGIQGGTVKGHQKIASVTFKTKAATGTATLAFSPNSLIYKGDAVNVWNGVTSGGAYTLKTPGTGGGGTGGTGGTGGGGTQPTTGGSGSSTPTTGGSSSTNKSTTKTTTPTTSTPTTTPSTDQPVTTTSPTTGNVVAIVVTDKDGRAVAGATVTIDTSSMVTDGSGIANFTGLSTGKHTVKVVTKDGTSSRTITVAATSSGETQRFDLKIKPRINYLLYAVIAVVAVLFVVLLVLGRRWQKNRTEKNHHFPDEVVVGGESKAKEEAVEEEAPVLVTPKLIADEPVLTSSTDSKSKGKLEVQPSDTLDEIEKKVGANKDIAQDDPNDVGPGLIKPIKTTKTSP
jgi:hypothetical protein